MPNVTVYILKNNHLPILTVGNKIIDDLGYYQDKKLRYDSSKEVATIRNGKNYSPLETVEVKEVFDLTPREYARAVNRRRRSVEENWKQYQEIMGIMDPWLKKGKKVPKRIIEEKDRMLRELPRIRSLASLLCKEFIK